MKIITVKYDEKEIKLTQGFVGAVKNLMLEQILMMRKVHPKSKDCWTFGVCEIQDMASSKGMSFMFCGDEDMGWMKKQGQISIHVPLKDNVERSVATEAK